MVSNFESGRVKLVVASSLGRCCGRVTRINGEEAVKSSASPVLRDREWRRLAVKY